MKNARNARPNSRKAGLFARGGRSDVGVGSGGIVVCAVLDLGSGTGCKKGRGGGGKKEEFDFCHVGEDRQVFAKG